MRIHIINQSETYRVSSMTRWVIWLTNETSGGLLWTW